MARTESINVLSDLTSPEGKMFLQEVYADVLENVQNDSVTTDLKNRRLSGDARSGSIVAKRFQNANSNPYGTARTAGKGVAIEGREVTINVNTRREFVEELEESDADFLGVEGLIRDRAIEHTLGMVWELDEAFFACAKSEGTQYKPATTLATIKDIVGDAIVKLGKTKNDYIRGINKNLMKLVCSPETYSELRDYIDTRTNANVNTAEGDIIKFHGVEVVEANTLPGETSEGAGDDVKFVLMMKQAIAQPVRPIPYNSAKIGLSDAYSMELYYFYGTAATTPEAIYWYDGTKASDTAKKASSK